MSASGEPPAAGCVAGRWMVASGAVCGASVKPGDTIVDCDAELGEWEGGGEGPSLAVDGGAKTGGAADGTVMLEAMSICGSNEGRTIAGIFEVVVGFGSGDAGCVAVLDALRSG